MSKREERAAAAAKVAEEARRRERRSTVLKVAAVVAAMAVIVIIGVIAGTHKGGNGKSETSAANSADAARYTLTVGDASAPHTIVFYEDFLCPYCGMTERASESGLDAAAKAGKVRIEYRPFNLLSSDPYSAQALNAFAAVRDIAGDDVALQFHNLLYQNQPEEPGPKDGADDLIKLANQVVPAADQAKVADAIKKNSYSAYVKGATAVAEAAGVTGTPTIKLDGQPFQTGSSWEDIGNNLVKAVS